MELAKAFTIRFADGQRTYCKNLGFAAVIPATITLGIGLNTAMFSIVGSVLLKPLPFSQPDRLCLIFEIAVVTPG